MQLSEAQVDRVLTRWPVARLAMLEDGQQPRLLPVVFARVAGTLWSPVDGKPKAGGETARIRHARSQPRVEVLIDHYDEDWRLLWWVRLEGIVRVVAPPHAETDPDVAPVLVALRRKYPQYAATPVLVDPPTLLAIRPHRIRSWCAGVEAGRALELGDAASQ